MIFVGVDHSAAAKEALRFALEEAQLRQATHHAECTVVIVRSKADTH